MAEDRHQFTNWVDWMETVKEMIDQKVQETEDKNTYKAVSALTLQDALVLSDGVWGVVAVATAVDSDDIISVTLENGLSYDLIRTALVHVEA